MAEREVRQRLAAILAADVAGYSRLMGDDERATIDALNACRDIFQSAIESHAGRVVDMAGDSVLAVFDTAIGAAEAALAAQEALAAFNADIPEGRRMRYRIGLNTGDIHEQDDGTVYGDGVNIAARLEAIAEPGGICVSDKVHLELRSKPDLSFADAGSHEVKNIAEPVRAYAVLSGNAVAATPARRARRLGLPALMAGGAFAVAILFAVYWFLDSGTDQPVDLVIAMPDGPSIMVLPFENLSGDPEQDYFVDGLATDITNAFTAFSLKVIGAGSAAVYADKQDDVSAIAAALGVRYLVKGSVRRLGDQLRISVQLIGGEDGSTLWGESFEADLSGGDLFGTMDDVVAAVVAQIAGEYGAINRTALVGLAGRAPASMTAYECYLRFYEYERTFAPEDHAGAIACLESSLEANSDYADGWAQLALLYGNDYQFGYGQVENARERAFDAAGKAVALDPSSPRAVYALGWAHYVSGRRENFIGSMVEAIRLNPNDGGMLGQAGPHLIWAGEEELGKTLLDKAWQLNPHYPPWQNLGYADYHTSRREYEQALDYVERCLAQQPNNPAALFWRSALLGHLGRGEEARQNIADFIETWPGMAADVKTWLGRYHMDDRRIEHYLEGARKAGFVAPDSVN